MELTLDQALKKGVEAHKAGKLQEAEQYYTAILKANPKHPDANHNMGVLAVGVGKVEQALPFFKVALEINPKIDQFWLSYIDALIKLDRMAEAKEVFEEAKSKGAKGDGFDQVETKLAHLAQTEDDQTDEEILGKAIDFRETGKYDEAIDLLLNQTKQSPTDPNILSALSHCYILNDNLEQAKIHLDSAKNINPNIASVGWNETRVLLKQQKVNEALAVADKTNKLFPDDVEGMGVLGSCLRAKGNFDEGLKYLNKAIELNPKYAEVLINRGLIYLNKHDKANASADLEKAHKLKPHLREIWNLVLNLKIELKKFEDAISLGEEMLKIDPLDEKIVASMALCHQFLNNFDQAVIFYNEAISIKPGFIEAYNNLGNALKQQGKLEEAIEVYIKAISIKPDFAEGHYNMGVVLHMQGKLDEAIEAYNKALSFKPDYSDSYNNMGVTLRDQGKIKEAIEAYNKALSIKPDFADAYNNMGLALTDQGKLGEAIKAYTKALSIKPDNAEAYSNMGVTLKDLGKREEAIEAYKKALSIKPDYAEFATNLAILFFQSNRFEEAANLFSMDKSIENQSFLLKCFYELDAKSKFVNQLDYLIKRGQNNCVIGSYACRAAIRYGTDSKNPFCNEPLKYVKKIDLTKKCDFKKIFVENAANVLSNSEVSHRAQGLLTNGIQTSGNIFTQVGSVTNLWQDLIRSELSKYKNLFCKSKEGFIQDWPSDYSLSGWLVSMKNGGELSAHIHDTGWITGSIYINVPPKTKKDSGNLVVATHDPKDGKQNAKDIKSIDVVTGSLCLFPSSLLHYTIPFESNEDRIVLAFDVVPTR